MIDAIVGGLVGGGLVLVGLIAHHLLSVRSARWTEIELCARNLNLGIGRVLAPMFVPAERALRDDPSWIEANRAVMQALVELRLLSRGRGKKRSEVRYLSFALALRLQAAVRILQTDSRELDNDDLTALTGPNRQLQQLLFGTLDRHLPRDPDAVDAAVAYLIEHRLDADEGWDHRGERSATRERA
jgi:hypothetical protein